MKEELQNILNEIELIKKPTIIQIAWWCKRAAEAVKRRNKAKAQELFIMAEICFNYEHISKKEIREYQKKYPILLKKYIIVCF